MKRTLTIIIFTEIQAFGIVFSNVWDYVRTTLGSGYNAQFSKLFEPVVFFFGGNKNIVANTRIFGVEPLEKVAFFNRIISAFKFHTSNHRTNFRKVNQLNAEGCHA